MITIISALLGATLLYPFFLSLYRLTLHPLAKYPGPKLNAISEWPQAIFNIRGRAHIAQYQLHEKYGDVVRVAPNVLLFRTVKAAHDIYDRKANVIKAGWTDVSLEINPTISTHNLNDRQIHAKRRRMLANAFSDSALRNQEHLIIDRIQSFCKIMSESNNANLEKKGWGQPRDMSTWANNLTLDVLGELCFGKTFGALETGSHMIGELLITSSAMNQALAFLPGRHLLYPLLRNEKVMLSTGAKAPKQRIEFRNAMKPLLTKRFAQEAEAQEKGTEPRHDFMHYLINAKDPETGEKFAPMDLVGEATLLVGAGSDTTSTCIAATLFYLIRSPTILRKLQDEVRAAFDTIDAIKSGATISSLPYLRAVIDEGLRISPPVPGALHRRVLPGGFTIDGHFVPEDTIVGASIYVVHHNESPFPRPFDFLPERWIPGSPDLGFPVTQSSLEHQKQAWFPFSMGPRNCVGKNMAMMELLITLARMVWLFDVRGVPGDSTGAGRADETDEARRRESEFQLKDYLICGREGPVVQFRTREGVTA